jgi:hypothetical protein
MARPVMAVQRKHQQSYNRRASSKEAWASKLSARLIDLTVPPAPNPQLSDDAGQALRLILWIMSAMRSLSCVPRFLSLNALPIRTRSVAV